MIDSPVDPYAAVLVVAFAIWQVWILTVVAVILARGHSATFGIGPGLVAVLLAILIVAT